MPSHSEGPGIWLSVWRFLLTHCLYERAAEVLARLRGCAGSPELSLLAQAISTKFAWRGPYNLNEVLIQTLKCPYLKDCREIVATAVRTRAVNWVLSFISVWTPFTIEINSSWILHERISFNMYHHESKASRQETKPSRNYNFLWIGMENTAC